MSWQFEQKNQLWFNQTKIRSRLGKPKVRAKGCFQQPRLWPCSRYSMHLSCLKQSTWRSWRNGYVNHFLGHRIPCFFWRGRWRLAAQLMTDNFGLCILGIYIYNRQKKSGISLNYHVDGGNNVPAGLFFWVENVTHLIIFFRLETLKRNNTPMSPKKWFMNGRDHPKSERVKHIGWSIWGFKKPHLVDAN
jgi:hypothetical protein